MSWSLKGDYAESCNCDLINIWRIWQNLSVDYKLRKETVHAAKDINIEIKRGEIVGLVGESGSGKSTVANAIIDLANNANLYLNERAPWKLI